MKREQKSFKKEGKSVKKEEKSLKKEEKTFKMRGNLLEREILQKGGKILQN